MFNARSGTAIPPIPRVPHDLFQKDGVVFGRGDGYHSAAPQAATKQHDQRITAPVRECDAQEVGHNVACQSPCFDEEDPVIDR